MSHTGEVVTACGPLPAGPLPVGPVTALTLPASAPATNPVGTGTAGDEQQSSEPISGTIYLGMVKSYNERRGFGFIACAETLSAYGRDVYMAKTEVVQLCDTPSGAGASVSKNIAWGMNQAEKVTKTQRIAEEDIVHFQVRLSVEGYPQAVHVRQLRKYCGVVMHPPPEEGSLPSDSSDDTGIILSDELLHLFGDRQVAVRRQACGQARLSSGDEVTFGIPELPACEGSSIDTPLFEAQQVVLLRTHHLKRAILGCFSLRLPRPRSGRNRAPRKDLKLDCHAFNDRVILAGLPGDADEAELRRFFTKQGAIEVITTRSRGCGFASVAFPGMAEVSRLLSRSAHAFTADDETQIAILEGRRACPYSRMAGPRLPALPAPSLMPGEVVGTLVVSWSPLVLAVGYVVELRFAGSQDPWSVVDNGTESSENHFDMDRSSCRVGGLDAATAYEGRVTYFTSCGCRAEASDTSVPCIPCPALFERPWTGGGVPSRPGGCCAGAGPRSGNMFGGFWPGATPAVVPMQVQASAAPAWPGLLGFQAPLGFHPGQAQTVLMPQGVLAAPHQVLSPQGLPFSAPPPCPQPSNWRCAHGAVIPPPSAPEVHPVDDYGFAISVQWPSVAHATAYVVELREGSSASVERFIRSAPASTRGSVVELRVGGLRPSGPLGQRYAAQVRCIAECGCESSPSTPGWSPTLGLTPQPTQMLPPARSGVQETLTGVTFSGADFASAVLQCLPAHQQDILLQVGSSRQTPYGFTQPQSLAAAADMPSWVPLGAGVPQHVVIMTSQSAGASSPTKVAGDDPDAATVLASPDATDLTGAGTAPPGPPPNGAPAASVSAAEQKEPPELTPELLRSTMECLVLD